MNIRDICRSAYVEYIRKADIPNELKRALKAHERIPVFIDNLARELSIAEMHPKIRMKGKLTRKEIEDTTRDFTKVFVENVKRESEERMMSDAAKRAMEAEAQRAVDLKAEADQILEESVTSETIQTDDRGNETSSSTHEIP